MKAAAHSPATAQTKIRVASEYAALASRFLGVMILIRVTTASFAKSRLGLYSNEEVYSDLTQTECQAQTKDKVAQTLRSEDSDDGLKVLDGSP